MFIIAQIPVVKILEILHLRILFCLTKNFVHKNFGNKKISLTKKLIW